MKSWPLLLILAFSLTACNLPGNTEVVPSEDAISSEYTHSAETLSAELTRLAVQVTPSVDIPTASYTTQPTNTTSYTPTKTSIPCLHASYSDATIDVTIPDFSVMTPGQAFTKIWRITNSGSCTWNSSYQLVFDHGDQLGVSSTYAQPLTLGTVAPGQTVDLSVNLVAPMTPGTYKGYWRARDPSSVYFGLGGSGTWAVVIVVTNATTVTLSPVFPGEESGTIRADGGPWTDFTAGESNADITKTTQFYVSYNIAGIPAGSTITEVKIDFTDYSTTGNPLPGLGVLQAYLGNFGTVLNSADFVPGLPSGNIADWGSLSALNVIETSPELKTALQSRIGTSRLVLRVQFGVSNMDGIKDRITFTNPSLIVTYTTP